MDIRIEKKDELKVIGLAKDIKNEEGYSKCPIFWDEFYEYGFDLLGMYGICIDNNSESGYFKYMIADDYISSKFYDERLEVYDIKGGLYAIFSCTGSIPMALQQLNTAVYTKWLPENGEYVLADNYIIEYYSDASKYSNGVKSDDYYCEIWLPVRRVR